MHLLHVIPIVSILSLITALPTFNISPDAPIESSLLSRQNQAVTCAVTTANAPGQSCPNSNTNNCPVKQTFVLGATVSVYCYTWGTVVQNNQMWYKLQTNNPHMYIAASYVQSKSRVVSE
jgi:hypothetical protein